MYHDSLLCHDHNITAADRTSHISAGFNLPVCNAVKPRLITYLRHEIVYTFQLLMLQITVSKAKDNFSSTLFYDKFSEQKEICFILLPHDNIIFLVNCIWSSWGPCSKTCGPGQRRRTQQQQAQNGGQQCLGADIQNCNERNCPFVSNAGMFLNKFDIYVMG